MTNSIVEQERSFLAILQHSSSTMNSGDAVGRYTGIKLSLFSAKYLTHFIFWTFTSEDFESCIILLVIIFMLVIIHLCLCICYS